MSFFDTVSLLFNKPLASVGSVEIDASVSEIHSASADITEFPVEDGSLITDHINKRPDVVQIEGYVSNTPIKGFTNFFGAAPIGSLANLTIGVSNDLAKTAYDKLLEIVEGNELITIVTTLRTYENMAIESFIVNRSASDGDVLHFTAVARQITLVQTAESVFPTEPLELRGEKNKPLGNKPIKESVNEDTEKSFLFKFFQKDIAVDKR